MEQKLDSLKFVQPPTSPNYRVPSRPSVLLSPKSGESSKSLGRHGNRTGSKRILHRQEALAYSQFSLKDSSSLDNKTAIPYVSPPKPGNVQYQTETSKEFRNQYSRHQRVQTSSYLSNSKEKERSFDQASSKLFHTREHSIDNHLNPFLRKESLGPQLSTSKFVQSSFNRKMSGLFYSRLFPMTDSRGKLNLKFFLKSPIASPVNHQLESKCLDSRGSMFGLIENANKQKQTEAETSVAVISADPVHLQGCAISLSASNVNVERSQSRLKNRESLDSRLKNRSQKSIASIHTNLTHERPLTKNDQRNLNDKETTPSIDRKVMKDENQGGLGDLLFISAKKKTVRLKDNRHEETNPKSENTNRGPQLFLKKSKISLLNREDRKPGVFNANLSSQEKLLNRIQAFVKQENRKRSEDELHGVTKWETIKGHRDSLLEDSLNQETTTRNLSPKENYLEVFGESQERRPETRIQNKEDKDQKPPRNVQEYKNFMMGLNFSYNVVIKQGWEKATVFYKYYIGKGNNHTIIHVLMKQRWWWLQTESKDSPDLNFMWTQFRNAKFISSLKCKRGMPITNGNNGNNGISSESDDIETNDKEVVPNVKPQQKDDNINNKKGKAIKKEGSLAGGNKQEDHFEKLFTSKEIALIENYAASQKKTKEIFSFEDWEEICRRRKKPAIQFTNDPSAFRMCNHMENNFCISDKKMFLQNLHNYYKALNKTDGISYLPVAFHIHTGIEDEEFKKFVEYYKKIESENQEEVKASDKKKKNLWMVKCRETLKMGTLSQVCNDISKITDLVSSLTSLDDAVGMQVYTIQQYVDRVLLLNKRRFKIRCFALLCCINNCMKGYWYQQGFIKISSQEKDNPNKQMPNKQFLLVTNTTQKNIIDYGIPEIGSTITFAELQKYLDQCCDGAPNFNANINPQLRSLTLDVIKSIYGKIDIYRRENCFEVISLDFVIDNDFKPWLIDVNTNPDLSMESPLQSKMIPDMLENVLRITVDQMFPPPINIKRPYPNLPENLLETNKFELIFDEIQDGTELNKLFRSQTKKLDRNLTIEIEDQ